MMTMIDMARTPEKQESNGTTPMACDSPVYPFGLCLSLGNEELEKLGLCADCEVGDMVHLVAMAKVTAVSSQDYGNGPQNRIELQIVMMGSENEEEESEQAMPAFSKIRGKMYTGG